MGQRKYLTLFPSLHGTRHHPWTVSPAVKLTLPSFRPGGRFCDCSLTHFWNHLLFIHGQFLPLSHLFQGRLRSRQGSRKGRVKILSKMLPLQQEWVLDYSPLEAKKLEQTTAIQYLEKTQYQPGKPFLSGLGCIRGPPFAPMVPTPNRTTLPCVIGMPPPGSISPAVNLPVFLSCQTL